MSVLEARTRGGMNMSWLERTERTGQGDGGYRYCYHQAAGKPRLPAVGGWLRVEYVHLRIFPPFIALDCEELMERVVDGGSEFGLSVLDGLAEGATCGVEALAQGTGVAVGIDTVESG